MSLPTGFTRYLDLINQSLMDSILPELAKSLREPMHYFLQMPGKKIRPLMTLYACEAVGGDIKDALPAATAIELFHDFTLIHDDIMDRDELRRGLPTLHKKYGEDTAILVGDALLGLCYQQLMKSPAQYLPQVMKIFSETLIKVSDGQALDKEFESRSDVTLDEYIDMIMKKTAWLFMDACTLGAICGGGSEEQVSNLKEFGRSIGLGFQVQDDLLDFVADESKLGKTVGSDFRLDKKTYVALKYRQMLTENETLCSQYPRNLSDFASLNDFREALDSLGVVKEVEALAERHLTDAVNALEKVTPLNDDSPLYQLTRFLQNRQY